MSQGNSVTINGNQQNQSLWDSCCPFLFLGKRESPEGIPLLYSSSSSTAHPTISPQPDTSTNQSATNTTEKGTIDYVLGVITALIVAAPYFFMAYYGAQSFGSAMQWTQTVISVGINGGLYYLAGAGLRSMFEQLKKIDAKFVNPDDQTWVKSLKRLVIGVIEASLLVASIVAASFILTATEAGARLWTDSELLIAAAGYHMWALRSLLTFQGILGFQEKMADAYARVKSHWNMSEWSDLSWRAASLAIAIIVLGSPYTLLQHTDISAAFAEILQKISPSAANAFNSSLRANIAVEAIGSVPNWLFNCFWNYLGTTEVIYTLMPRTGEFLKKAVVEQDVDWSRLKLLGLMYGIIGVALFSGGPAIASSESNTRITDIPGIDKDVSNFMSFIEKAVSFSAGAVMNTGSLFRNFESVIQSILKKLDDQNDAELQNLNHAQQKREITDLLYGILDDLKGELNEKQTITADEIVFLLNSTIEKRLRNYGQNSGAENEAEKQTLNNFQAKVKTATSQPSRLNESVDDILRQCADELINDPQSESSSSDHTTININDDTVASNSNTNSWYAWCCNWVPGTTIYQAQPQ